MDALFRREWFLRFAHLIILLAGLLHLSGAIAEAPRPGCDSCLFKISSLDKPRDLSGRWLFTRKDDPQNKAVDVDTANWELINAPGPWFWVEPGKTFTVGWYRGVFEFPPEMIGQKVVVFMDTYLSRTDIFLDGELIFRRPDPEGFHPFYPIQAIPAAFTITKTRHVFTFRIQSFMMTGPYQLPLKIQKADAQAQSTLSISQIWGGGGLVRLLAGYISLMFALFFLFVHLKTRGGPYRFAAMASASFFPFFGFPGESFIRSWGPEVSYFLHYMGLYVSYFVYLFVQYFTGWRPRLNKGFGIVCLASATLFPFLAFVHQDATLTLVARYLCISLAFTIIFCALGDLIRAFLKDRSNKDVQVLTVSLLITVVAASNDGGIDFGLIQSYGTLSGGFLVLMVAILWVASANFANTFLENKKLAKDLKVMNEHLEDLVAERTTQLRQKTNDIQAMLQNMPQGVLTVLAGGVIHPEYSAHVETIFETTEIAGQHVMQLIFAGSGLNADELAQVDAAAAACIGEDKMNFEFNAHLLVTEFEKTMADGSVKSLELSWSPICDDNDVIERIMLCVRDVTELKRLTSEANAQKRELEVIGEILAVSQEKFQDFIDSARQFIAENDALIRRSAEKDLTAVSLLFRNMHTIKGNARTYALHHLTNIVHEAEQAYDEMRKNADMPWEPESLLAQLEQVRTVIDEYAKINETTLGRKGPGRRGNVERYLMVDKEQIAQTLELVKMAEGGDLPALRGTLMQIGQTLNLLGTEKIHEALSGIVESMPSLARELGKEPPQIVINVNGIVVRSQISGLLKNLFTHLFRNAMDHGLEAAEIRRTAGKPAAGHLQLDVSVEHGLLLFRLRDDGRGLAVARIRKIAIEKNLLPPLEHTPDEQVAQMIFASGFSTAAAVTEVSGRGVGMDAVKGFVEREGGRVELRFLDNNAGADYRTFETVISLPEKFAVKLADGELNSPSGDVERLRDPASGMAA